MTLMIDLTPEQEDRLRRKAEKSGRNADTLAREAVLEMLRNDDTTPDDDSPAPGESLYDLLKDDVGGFHSGGGIGFWQAAAAPAADAVWDNAEDDVYAELLAH